MMPIFAQSTDLPSVPADFLKWTIIVLAALLLIGLYVWQVVGSRRVRLDDNPPSEFRKADKLYNHDATDQRFGRIESRLKGHDSELDSLWQEMRTEDTAIRETHARNFADVKSDLSAMKGTLTEVDKNVSLLLQAKIKS